MTGFWIRIIENTVFLEEFFFKKVINFSHSVYGVWVNFINFLFLYDPVKTWRYFQRVYEHFQTWNSHVSTIIAIVSCICILLKRFNQHRFMHHFKRGFRKTWNEVLGSMKKTFPSIKNIIDEFFFKIKSISFSFITVNCRDLRKQGFHGDQMHLKNVVVFKWQQRDSSRRPLSKRTLNHLIKLEFEERVPWHSGNYRV